MLVLTEFGRRIRDNGSGTDHGAGGGAFVIGDRIQGGLHAEYPSLELAQQEDGDMRHTYDFRGMYSHDTRGLDGRGGRAHSRRHVRASSLVSRQWKGLGV